MSLCPKLFDLNLCGNSVCDDVEFRNYIQKNVPTVRILNQIGFYEPYPEACGNLSSLEGISSLSSDQSSSHSTDIRPVQFDKECGDYNFNNRPATAGELYGRSTQYSGSVSRPATSLGNVKPYKYI